MPLMKVLLVAGARPNFMKIPRIYRASRSCPEVECKIVHTGQHYDRRGFERNRRGEADPKNGFDMGWNTRYITDIGKSVRFYVRGNEFTRQLDYFIDCIEAKKTENVASFAEGLKTDMLMEEITKDAARSLAQTNAVSGGARMLQKGEERHSFLKKLFGGDKLEYLWVM
jgi:hypothetical protein